MPLAFFQTSGKGTSILWAEQMKSA